MFVMLEQSHPKILFVEDNLLIRFSLTKALKRRGYAVTSAGDGCEALAAFEKESFDLLLTDIEMPRMDGRTLYQILRKKFDKLPVIIFSSCVELIELDVSMGCLYNDNYQFISKSVSIDKLFEAIRCVFTKENGSAVVHESTSDKTGYNYSEQH